ncbi:MAG: RES family NAD+ phosphorylase [Pseudomonadota bacterium]
MTSSTKAFSASYSGPLFRSINSRYLSTPFSGEGARRYGGRFNLVGRAALYTCTTREAIYAEWAQWNLPTRNPVVEFHCDYESIYDATSDDAVGQFGFSHAELGRDDWRWLMDEGRDVPSQLFAERVIAAGFTAILVRCYAAGRETHLRNVVFYDWEDGADLNLTHVHYN